MNKDPKNLRTVSIAGTGVYLPEKIVTNDDLSKIVDTNDEWIYTRTGMRERRIARDDQATSDLAAEAAKAALADAGVSADERWIDIDLSEQVLVAYQGDRPVLASVMSIAISKRTSLSPPEAWGVATKR